MRSHVERSKRKVLGATKMLTDIDCKSLVIYFGGVFVLGVLYFVIMNFMAFTLDFAIKQALLISLIALPIELVAGLIIKNRVGMLEKLQYIILAFHIGFIISAVSILVLGQITMYNGNLIALRLVMFFVLSAVMFLDWVMGKTGNKLKIKELKSREEVFMIMIYTVLVVRSILYIHQMGLHSGGLVNATFAVFSSLAVICVFFMLVLYLNSMYILLFKKGFRLFLVTGGIFSVFVGVLISIQIRIALIDFKNLNFFEVVLFKFMEITPMTPFIARAILFESILMVSVVFIMYNLFQMEKISFKLRKISFKSDRGQIK